jgi:hypothetical protein
MEPSLRAHSEARGEAIQKEHLDCFVALLLAMTRALGQFRRNQVNAFRNFESYAPVIPRRGRLGREPGIQ